MGHISKTAWGLAIVGLMSTAGAVNADSVPVQWITGTDANGNYYQRIDTGNVSTLTFQDAEADAAAMTIVEAGTTYHGELAILNGDLAQYDAAFSFIHDNVMYPAGTLAGNNQGY